MSHKTKWCIGITAGLLCVSLLASIFIYTHQSESAVADIYQNGELIESIDLKKVTTAYQLTVSADNGGSNVIDIQPGKIAVIDATCPDQVCVHAGYIQNGLLPITCLPNHLIIQIRTDGQSADGLDAIAY